MADSTPIRRLEIDTATAMNMQPGDRIIVVDGHAGHFVVSKRFENSDAGAWVTIRCSCGAVLGGKIVLTPPHAIKVVESQSVTIEGPPMRGTCSSCGTDLIALARTGVTGHVCFGPGDSTNHREPS